ncbi:MAG: NAD-dependent epimerase/dehydratase family protein [Pseudomonadota bacterium]|nr:NAD-dependent epimerase/dehydratase family protein [Pseudomonadota bacterium]
MRLAITGGTGFVGSRLIDAAVVAGHQVEALTRRPMTGRPQVTWVEGDLEDEAALGRLTRGSDAVIHVAGVVKGRTAADFDRCNLEGTRAMAEAARSAGVKRFVHVSSLAAREPSLSLYGASKARSEEVMSSSGVSHAIVRPPAVYGPGDKEMLELFRMAKLGLVMLPPAGRLSVIHVDDLARLLLALADPAAPSGLLVEPDDGRPGGWTHKEFAAALGRAVGRKPLSLSVPAPLLKLSARADQLLRGDKAKLTTDRATYFSHPDWVVDSAQATPRDLWSPAIPTDEGLASTTHWYQERGWL